MFYDVFLLEAFRISIVIRLYLGCFLTKLTGNTFCWGVFIEVGNFTV